MSGGSNEWELLEIAEQIEPGNYVIVEDGGVDIRMQFVRYDRGIVHLKDARGSWHKFRGASLEALEGEAVISQKADDE